MSSFQSLFGNWVQKRLLERDLLPDALIRFGIRRLLRRRLAQERAGDLQARHEELLASLREAPIALHTDDANEQHYQVPTEFFRHVLGKHMKYSGGYWPPGTRTLDESEAAMLELSCRRARLDDHQEILELGCGWGSMTLYVASRYPHSRIVAVSNSATQRQFILGQAKERGLDNVEVITADMNDFDLNEEERRFDRVISIEMLEHMRNYQHLFRRIAKWMKDDGRFFAHVFCHRDLAYPFEVRDASDWMARYFFTGGLMPSARLFYEFDEDIEVEESWPVDGTHYEKTAEAWLANMDAHEEQIRPILAATYGEGEETSWWVRWRVFFMACAELFGTRDGEEWLVCHYRFRKAG